jgi:hypothetical protein
MRPMITNDLCPVGERHSGARVAGNRPAAARRYLETLKIDPLLDPLLDPLRKEPRFQEIERELKFPS